MEERRRCALEASRLVRRQLIRERVRPVGLDSTYDFRAEDVYVEPSAGGAELVVLFRACGKNRLLDFWSAMVDYRELAHRENADQEIAEMNVADVLTDLVEDFLTGTISEPNPQGISWVEPRRRRDGPGRS